MGRGLGFSGLFLLSAVVVCSACALVSPRALEDGPLEVGERPEDIRKRAWFAVAEAATTGYEQRCIDTGGLLPDYVISVSPKRIEEGVSDDHALGEWLAEWFWLLPGDVDGSCSVNSADLAIVAKYWGERPRASDLPEVRDADLNQDGIVSKPDAELVGYNWDAAVWEHELQCRDNNGGPWIVVPSIYYGTQEPFSGHELPDLERGGDVPGDVFSQDPTGMEMRVQFITASVLEHPDVDDVASTSNGIAIGYETAAVYPDDLGLETDQDIDRPLQEITRRYINERSVTVRYRPPNIGQETLIFRDSLDEPLIRSTEMFEYWIDETVEPYREYDYYACTEYQGMRSVFIGPLRCRWNKQLVSVTENAGQDYQIVPSSGITIGEMVYVGGQLLSYQIEQGSGSSSYPSIFSCTASALGTGEWDSCAIEDTRGFDWIELASLRGKPAAVYFVQEAEGRNLHYARATCQQPKGPDDFSVCNLGAAYSVRELVTLTDIDGRPMLTFRRQVGSSTIGGTYEIVIAAAKSINPRRLDDWDIYPMPGSPPHGNSLCVGVINGKPVICAVGHIRLNEPVSYIRRLVYLAATKPVPGKSDWIEIVFDTAELCTDSHLAVLEVDGKPWIVGLVGRSTGRAAVIRSTTTTPTSASDWIIETTDEPLLSGLVHAQLFDVSGTPVFYAVGVSGPVFAWPEKAQAAIPPLCEWQASPVLKTRTEMMNYHGFPQRHEIGFDLGGKIAAFTLVPQRDRCTDDLSYWFSIVQYGIPIGDSAELGLTGPSGNESNTDS